MEENPNGGGRFLADRPISSALVRPWGLRIEPARRAAGAKDAILHQIKSGRHNLVVMGVSMRPGEQLDFGRTDTALLDGAECLLMFVVS
jgi:hypothetical protein